MPLLPTGLLRRYSLQESDLSLHLERVASCHWTKGAAQPALWEPNGFLSRCNFHRMEFSGDGDGMNQTPA